jgi:predicted nuclease of predicted toxin-antitoxin system
MRWLLDQGLPLSAATLLCDAGDDAVHVGQIGMAEAEDSQILLHAHSRQFKGLSPQPR